MVKEYKPEQIEKKWQEKWQEKNVFKSENKVEGKQNYYTLEMFAYPSGKLHVGHLRNYAIGDAIARYKKMKGFNVLHPFGWDSFGLPAENAAIDNGAHPGQWTKANIDNMRRQLKLMGLSYDWDREISTYTPEYYKWNQLFFIEMYKKGLVYKKRSYVNWCPDCNTVLANEQVEDGKCWRHSKTDVIQKELSQWYLKITDYAEELLQGHEELKGHWPDKVLAMQKNWIGKSTGSEINFVLDYKFDSNSQDKESNLNIGNNGEIIIPVFTTRADTLFGVTYAVIAPEHPLVEEIVLKENPSLKEAVDKMINEDKINRTAEDKEKEGMFTGLYVINPVNNEKVPLWIGNYVLMDYGTGAVMAVPAHDERDFFFAKKYNLPVRIVINPVDKDGNPEKIVVEEMEGAYTLNGILVNSDEFDGTKNTEAKIKITEKLEKEGKGKKTVNYRLHDWLISRQRYWGTPIPVIYDEDGNIHLEEKENLPVKLPTDIEFNGKGNPLETSEEFKNVTLPNGKKGRRETDTMDTFVDSSWYYLRYLDSHNTEKPFEKENADSWTPVDQYIGGIEHAVMHLLYARFFHKALRDMGLVETNEPFKRLLTQGMVLGPSYYSQNERKFYFPKDVEIKDTKAFSKATGEELTVKIEKMSKSKNNGVDPEEIVKEYGADPARVFTLFAAPPEKELEWNVNGLAGAYRFINRLFLIISDSFEFADKNAGKENNYGIDLSKRSEKDEEIQKKLHQTVKKVTESIEDDFHFNTAIAAVMELLNDMTTYKQEVIDKNDVSTESRKIWKEVLDKVILLITPFAPHIADELWEIIGNTTFTFEEEWPTFEEELTKEHKMNLVVQINGKIRETIPAKIGLPKEEYEKLAFDSEKIKKAIEGKEIVKVIVVPNKLVNIVVKG
ncbi:leucine--tRNA ligase [Leptotrichia sp. oral taxon 215 str. W9775]|uniref:leucine--tRNA ligase n=1 Tax=Leptotrichia sp. oral taxon 215 TaxID=712359 RepID=UPI0003AE10B4|nr:leucine--tRNA ligase [Leptotrichia sp. oral taxon 215]ERK68973.1 leucine--tRNA ligase [Leptotrichia sp. oral taxon 215 str. W9775]